MSVLSCDYRNSRMYRFHIFMNLHIMWFSSWIRKHNSWIYAEIFTYSWIHIFSDSIHESGSTIHEFMHKCSTIHDSATTSQSMNYQMKCMKQQFEFMNSPIQQEHFINQRRLFQNPQTHFIHFQTQCMNQQKQVNNANTNEFTNATITSAN